MTPRYFVSSRFVVAGFSLLLALASFSPEARANVYATNVKLNDGTNDLAIASGDPITISYILNETPSRGVTVDIMSASTIARSIKIPVGEPGALRGTNSITWDGKGNSGGNVAGGTYNVRITPASAGYPAWTQTTTDDDGGSTHVWWGAGIAVDRNPLSPYYGRIFVSNARFGTDPLNRPGDRVGILKLNADGSFAEEDPNSTGGHEWSGDGFSPWHLEVSSDDYVYVNDWTSRGEIFRFDPAISTNSLLEVLRQDNWGPDVSLSGPALYDSGTNVSLWMADIGDVSVPGSSKGILKWKLGADGSCAAQDTGTSVVGIGGDLTLWPYDLALDKQGNMFTIQSRTEPGDPSPRVMRFPAYDPSTNAGSPEITATWAVGSSDDTMGQASGVAVDDTGRYVAVAFVGVSVSLTDTTNGCVQIFNATNGTIVTNLDLGVSINGDAKHQDTDCAWDAVGNVYYIDLWQGFWRAFSPPGTNQASTVAWQKLVISGGGGGGSQPVPIGLIEVNGNTVTITFKGSAGSTVASFTVLAATSALGPYGPISATISAVGNNGEYIATVTAGAVPQFYRVVEGSTTPPPSDLNIESLSVQGSTVTLLFTSTSTDTASMFTVLGNSTAAGTYLPVNGATVAQDGSAGHFKATFPTNAPIQFYKVRK